MSSADREKMSELEKTIADYKNQLSKLERLLKEEEEIINDPDKKEEVEKLRDDLKDNMIV